MPKTTISHQKGKLITPLDCGEDSFCVSETGTEVVLGIADGVSGTGGKNGGNPKLFAESFMQNIPKVIKKKSGRNTPKTILRRAFIRLVDDIRNKKIQGIKNGGAATACVLFINKESGALKYANLGDSGFVLMSPDDEGNYTTQFKSEYQLKTFNFPFQFFMTIDKFMLSDFFYIGANTREITVKPNDVILLMTDGVFDNLFDWQLEKLVTKSMRKGEGAVELAEGVTLAAWKRSNETWGESPMGAEAEKYGKEWDEGGKQDDITVIATIIK